MIDTLLKYIAPHHCYGCGQNGSVLCQSCYDDINSDDFGRCLWCLRATSQGNQCRLCARRVGTSGAWVVGERSEVLQRLVGDYKYESVREARQPLTALLDDVTAMLPAHTQVTSVPTIRHHIRQRGFDHARELASGLAKRRGLVYASLLDRQRQYAQHELSKQERFRVAAVSFSAKAIPMPPRVLLIDDIVTTGATLRACTEVLREAGVKEVFVGVVARQMLK